jgi:hypothetical protein
MRWVALIGALVVLGCDESEGDSSAPGAKVSPDRCLVDSSGDAVRFVGTYLGNAHVTVVNPVDAGVSNEEPPGRVDIAYLYCNDLQVSVNFGSVCDKLGSPPFTAAIQSPTTTFFLVEAPLCLRRTKDRPGSAAFFNGRGSVTGETLVLEVNGGVYFNGDAGYAIDPAWPYTYTFTGVRTGP